MKIVFYNLHVYSIVGRTLYNFITRSKSYGKYEYLLNYHRTHNVPLYLFVDRNGSSLLPRWLSRIIRPAVEARIWAVLNNIPLTRLKIITKIDSLEKNDILFGFSLGILDTLNSDIHTLCQIKCIKIFHLTHFVQNTDLIASRVQEVGVNLIVAESNLGKNSPYFKRYFPKYKKSVYTLPFSFQNRFVLKKDISKRLNKCLAIGTLVRVSDVEDPKMFREFSAFFHSSVLQPLRESIWSNRSKLGKYIDSSIGLLVEKKLSSSSKQNVFSRIHNFYIHTRRSYFKFDMVDRCNSYSMCVNGEEINNLPGIGFVEAMASGCAYIGLDDPMYTDLGLIPGKHYISHEGTLLDLIKKIQYYQTHSKQLMKIAQSGHDFVKSNFAGDIVAEKFYYDLHSLAASSEASKKIITKFKCSFVK